MDTPKDELQTRNCHVRFRTESFEDISQRMHLDLKCFNMRFIEKSLKCWELFEIQNDAGHLEIDEAKNSKLLHKENASEAQDEADCSIHYDLNTLENHCDEDDA